jgi:hypothetical protein
VKKLWKADPSSFFRLREYARAETCCFAPVATSAAQLESKAELPLL